jgi:hypothetical protein
MVRRAAQPLVTTEEAKEVFAGDLVAVDHVYTDPEGKPLPLVARLAKIMGDLPVLDPEGNNKFFNYRFIKDKQVLGIVRPRLARQLILIVPETVEEREVVQMTTQKGGTSLMTRITVTWRIVDGINGESFTGQSVGYGDDSGDKGANKAFTAALKNFLIKLFQIGGEPDIEEDEGTDTRAKARESGAKQISKAVIGDATVENVERGGKAKKATEAQVSHVGQYVRDLHMDPTSFSAFLMRKFEIHIEFSDDPWVDIKNLLEGMDGTSIGAVIAALDELLNTVDKPEPSDTPYE